MIFLHDEEQRSNPGSLYALAQKVHLPSDEGEFISWLTERTVQLIDGEERNVAKTIFSIMIAAFDGKNCQIPGVIDGLIHHLFRNSALSQIAAETLSWMNNNWKGKKDHFWHPTSKQIEQLLTVATKSDCNSMTLLWLATIFGEEKTHQAVSILLPHLPICTARNRITIVEALGAIGDARSTEALIKHLQTISEKRSIRQAAANGVGNVGGKLALEALLTVLNNIIAEDWEVRQTAATALGEIGGERALNALLERVQDTQEEQGVCQAAINALGKIGDKRAVDALLARLLDREEEQENIRHVAVSTLGQIGDERAIDGLLARFLDAKEKPYIQQEAAKALGKIGGERATEVLKPYLENEEKELCRAALGGLAQTCEDELDRKLLSSDLDGIGPWLDPQAAITAALVAKASEKLEQPAEEIASRYKELAQRFGLTMDPESLAIAEENPRTEADQPN